MYYYYAIISRQAERGVTYTTDYIGWKQTRVDVIKYFRDELNGHIVNMIELTEDEYQELHKKHESEN